MQNEPQLSAEIEEKFEQMWTEGTGLHDRAKHFLATALEEQKKATLDLLDKAELEKWFDMPDTTENWKTWKKIRNTINREGV